MFGKGIVAAVAFYRTYFVARLQLPAHDDDYVVADDLLWLASAGGCYCAVSCL